MDYGRVKEINTRYSLKLEDGYRGENPYEGVCIITTEGRIEVIIDARQDCCEIPGYIHSQDDPADYIGKKILGLKIVPQEDSGLGSNPRVLEILDDERFEGDFMFVELLTDIGPLSLALYNIHNGYYGHKAYVRFVKHIAEKTL